MSKVEADGAGEKMTEQNTLPGSNAEVPKKKELDLGCRRAFKFDHLCALNFDQV